MADVASRSLITFGGQDQPPGGHVRRAIDREEASPPGEIVVSVGPLLLLATLVLGLGWQGAYHRGGQVLLGVGLLATTAITHTDRPRRRTELAPPVVAVAGLGLWTAANGLIHSSVAIGAAALAAAVAVTVTVARRFDPLDRAVLLGALPGAGGLLALSGWLGLVTRMPGWSQEADGLWRAAGLLSYSNALAAALAMLALLGIAGLSPVGDPGTEPVRPLSPAALCLATTLMVAVLLATLSRAGLLSLAVGLAVLLARGGWCTVHGAVAPLAGGCVAFAGLAPSFSAASPGRPVPAVAGLIAGALVGEVLRRAAPDRSAAAHGARSTGRARSATPALVAVAALGLLAALSPLRPMLRDIVETRLGSGSSYRLPAARRALSAWAHHPIEGLGTGRATMTWRDGAGARITLRYLHDEYLQVLVEQGLVGATLLAAAAVGAVRLALAGDPGALRPLRSGAISALAAFAVSSGFDITWHIAAPVVLAASIYGAALTPQLPPAARPAPSESGRPPSPRPTTQRKDHHP